MGRGLVPREAIVRAVARVGESVTFLRHHRHRRAGFVAGGQFSAFYADLGVPLAIGIGVMLVAALTLLPALTGHPGQGRVLADEDP